MSPRSGNLASVVSMVYRYDQAALQDWTRLLGGDQLQLLPKMTARLRDAVLRLQVEYVEKCIPASTALSLPIEGALRHFVIVEKQPVRKKRMVSDKMRRWQAMGFPVSVQWLARAPVEDQHGQLGQLGQQDDIAVRYEGVPEFVELVALTQWSVLRGEFIQ